MDTTNRNPRVSIGIGITLNTGNYQSVKIYVSEEIDCLENDPDEVLEYLQGRIIQRLLNEEKAIIEQLGL